MATSDLLKAATAGFGSQQFPTRMMGRFAPVEPRRSLTEPELISSTRGERQWWPPIIQSDAQPLPDLLASPERQALLAGVPAAALGGAAGYGISSTMGMEHPERGAALGAAAVGIPAALATAIWRWKRNQHVKEVMRRLPEHAVKRDLIFEEMLSNALGNRFGATKYGGDRLFGLLTAANKLFDKM